MVVKGARMEGFAVFNYTRKFGEALRAMSQWVAEGRLKLFVWWGLRPPPSPTSVQPWQGGRLRKSKFDFL